MIGKFRQNATFEKMSKMAKKSTKMIFRPIRRNFGKNSYGKWPPSYVGGIKVGKPLQNSHFAVGITGRSHEKWCFLGFRPCQGHFLTFSFYVGAFCRNSCRLKSRSGKKFGWWPEGAATPNFWRMREF